jgi:hypothetical protein
MYSTSRQNIAYKSTLNKRKEFSYTYCVRREGSEPAGLPKRIEKCEEENG